jgi:hypothetical protein
VFACRIAKISRPHVPNLDTGIPSALQAWTGAPPGEYSRKALSGASADGKETALTLERLCYLDPAALGTAGRGETSNISKPFGGTNVPGSSPSGWTVKSVSPSTPAVRTESKTTTRFR